MPAAQPTHPTRRVGLVHSVAPSMMPRWLLLPCGLREAFAAVSRTQDFVQVMRPRAAYQQCVRAAYYVKPGRGYFAAATGPSVGDMLLALVVLADFAQ